MLVSGYRYPGTADSHGGERLVHHVPSLPLVELWHTLLYQRETECRIVGGAKVAAGKSARLRFYIYKRERNKKRKFWTECPLYSFLSMVGGFVVMGFR